ncbi:type III-B CRISPR-associated protein Cas10/Cmr2 [Leptolyngbya cf. ectocarpi LEGE 11479]|uniref:Type III-B CRISPR-associated protein Cas10/Cmr2 n=1 Tax=Leptolyngbya cf. ectocarpi LEGE 11479 TaxID=1828722 RepID=A0A929F9Q1_LEPEC|nr:type III-B CRISPR-associated protein Cas10/Cmr2 [Leptolyngbya cf. ectocarpi LEGE 11479]
MKSDTRIKRDIQIAIAWCLTWTPNNPDLKSLHQALAEGKDPEDASFPQNEAFQAALTQAQKLDTLQHPETKDALEELIQQSEYEKLWNTKIGLVYGGVTKVKSYVFESADLQEIRGASGLLDRINLVDLPAFFHAEQSEDIRFEACANAPIYCRDVVRRDWLEQEFSELSTALIPQLIIYSTGGNILAFCPAQVVDQLANAIEKRYTTETLTANSCAVGEAFSPLEIRLGVLQDPISQTLWIDELATQADNPALQAAFDFKPGATKGKIHEAFEQCKTFSELTGKLANLFNQRRSGYDLTSRPSRCYPPAFETHPYLQRDDVDQRSAVTQIQDAQLPDSPKLSEPSARKRRVGQITKREDISARWYRLAGFEEHWNPEITEEITFQSWVSKFENFLRDHQLVSQYDSGSNIFNSQGNLREPYKREARALNEIGDASKGYIAYIYADGNNMGQYIRDEIKTPEDYQRFSQDVFEATEQSVYWALAECMHPHHYIPDARSPRTNKDPVDIHPFEIVAIGGDDVLLIVPANKALEVAHKIGEHFERILKTKKDEETGKARYPIPASGIPIQLDKVHRYDPEDAEKPECRLSISSGVLITAANTPIYYADRLVTQLLKSSKKKAKALKKNGYYGGTVDILPLKAVTMISSDIQSFREEGLTVQLPHRNQELKLYASPYTLHELDGLIETIRGFKEAGFPKSQLYQIRSLLERGKRTAILNYRYFRVRLSKDNQAILRERFEQPWCAAKTNPGNLAPWLPPEGDDNQDEVNKEKQKTTYETLWRELVELFDFIEPQSDLPGSQVTSEQTTEAGGERS